MKSPCHFRRRTLVSVWFFIAAIITFTSFGLSGGIALAQEFTTEFALEDCKFKNKGENRHFILQPGYQLVLEGVEDGEEIRVVITVLKRTEKIDLPGIGVVSTRIVEEREFVDGDLIEVSRNFFAICEKTNDVFYFGEDVDICEDGSLEQNGDGFLCNGEEPSHEGAWRAGVDDALPGIIMPGTFLLGSRYFQEQAPGVALDRAEHVEMGLTVDTPAGTFEKCVRVIETTTLEPGAESEKIYCPEVGVVVDDVVQLVEFGKNIVDDDGGDDEV